ncbi:hypothetical protein [Sinorhizobium meliloti]|uniref:hypothetical protein n=1 Tax=Rhizobium meliloti TaxID=382 RepID=UPI000EFAF6CD|nr:hypothetical protein [Sinorhizobium meliloti]RMI06327.1 hypothetical protein DA101_028745 [Sinorhizobium meliloti]
MPRLLELGHANRCAASFDVDITAAQVDRLPEMRRPVAAMNPISVSNTTDRNSPLLESSGGGQKTEDLVVGIDVGRQPPP